MCIYLYMLKNMYPYVFVYTLYIYEYRYMYIYIYHSIWDQALVAPKKKMATLVLTQDLFSGGRCFTS